MGYHFFRRNEYSNIGKPPSDLDLDFGLRILGSILNFGLLLKPELSKRNQAHSSATPRICFTEDSLQGLCEPKYEIRGQLCNHFDIFGPFAIGIKNKKARQLGLCPVLSTANLDTGESLSKILMGSLKQVHNTLAVLAHIESLANSDHDYFSGKGYALRREHLEKFGVQLNGTSYNNRSKVLRAINNLDTAANQVIDVFETLDTERIPFWQLTQLISLIVDLEQDADSMFNNRHLAFYKQREWRIQRVFQPTVGITPISAEKIEQFKAHHYGNKIYLEAFKKYWGNDYDIGPNDWLITEVEDAATKKRLKIFEIIDEIVYPSNCDKIVKSMVKEHQKESDVFKPRLISYPIKYKHDKLRNYFIKHRSH